MAGMPGHLGGGGVAGGRGGTDAEQITLMELMRLQHAAMHAHAAGGAGANSGGGMPVVSGDGREHLMMGAMEDSPQIAYIQGNYHMAQLPAGVGYVTAPMAHHGKSVDHLRPTVSDLCCTRTAPAVASTAARSHPDRLLRVHPDPSGYTAHPNRGLKRPHAPNEYNPRPSPYAVSPGLHPGPQMYQVVPLTSVMGAGGAYPLMSAPQPTYHGSPMTFMPHGGDAHAEEWGASMHRASTSISLGQWAHVCGTPSVAPLEASLVYQLLRDVSFRPGPRPTTFSRDKTKSWIFKEGKLYVSPLAARLAFDCPAGPTESLT